KALKYIDKASRANQVAWWDQYERGQKIADPIVEAASRALHAETDRRTTRLIQLDQLAAERAILNYLGRYWSGDSATRASFFRTIMGRRPYEGPKSFLKERSIEFFIEGLKRGLIPATYNLLESQLWKIEEMDRLISRINIRNAEKKFGRAKVVMIGKQPPVDGEGNPWQAIDRAGNDPAFTVWMRGTIPHWEAVDTMIFGKLEELARALGVKHTRGVHIGMPRSVSGFALPSGRSITTRFGGAEGTIAHELGHAIDFQYRLKDKILAAIGSAPKRVVQTGKKAGKQVPDYSVKGGDTQEMRDRRKALNEELRQLANLRRETMAKGVPETKDLGPNDRAYLHNWPEKMANMVEAYVFARDRFKKVAPGIFSIFDGIVKQHPELRPLENIQPSLSREMHIEGEELPGPMKVGQWYAPRASIPVYHNMMSKGLRGKSWYDALTAPGFAAAQSMLVWPGFHGTNISIQGLFSELAMAMEEFSPEGSPLAALKAVGRGVSAPASGAILGRRILAQYHKAAGTAGPHPALEPIVQGMVEGGFRGQQSSEFWSGDRTKKLQKAWADAIHGDTKLQKAWGASRLPADFVYSVLERASKPLLGQFVPMMKAAATAMAVGKRMSELPPDLINTNPERFRQEMWDIVKEMDFRFGLVNYENYFINNLAKDLAQAVFFAPGWAFGNLATMYRGGRDIANVPGNFWKYSRGKLPKDKAILGRTGKYMTASVLAHMLITGVISYLLSGQQPGSGEDGWKDFFFFRDGTEDADGNANRYSLPGYVAHDWHDWLPPVPDWAHQYLHIPRGMGGHPIQTLTNKLTATLGFAYGLFVTNRDYYGNLMRDPDATSFEQAKQVGQRFQRFLPIPVQNYMEAGKRRPEQTFRQKAPEIGRQAFGINPAKREMVRTDAQNELAELRSRMGHTAETPEQVDAQNERNAALRNMRAGEGTIDQVNKALQSGQMTLGQYKDLLRRAGIIPMQESFKALTIEDATKVLRDANPRERGLFDELYLQKLQNAINAGKPIPAQLP
ncbi:MAG TPA: hypothetical protein VNN79_11790, partial [Actinomycetota bacterium]|nr:hypothetical protein [Actinomycetota bacterium]